MRKVTLVIAAIALFLVPILFSNIAIAGAQTYGNTQTTYTLASSGTIQNIAQNTTNTANLTLQIKNGYYEIINAATQELIIGGQNNLAGINGSSFSAVTQAAEDTLTNGGSLEIAEGNYISDASVSIKGNTTISGHGYSTFIRQKALIAPYQSVFIIPQGISNVTIMNLAIDGNLANQIRNGDTMNHGILAMGSKILIDNVQITNMLQCGIDVPFASNITIQNSKFSGSGDGDIWIDINTKNYVVKNNTINNGNIGIALVFADNDGDHEGLVTDNTISNMSIYGIECWKCNTIQPSGVTISYNRIMNCYGSGIVVQGFTNSTLEYNTVTNSGTDGITLSGSTYIIIRGNNLNGNENFAIKQMSGSDYNTIIDNNLVGNKWGAFGYGNPTVDGVHNTVTNNIQ